MIKWFVYIVLLLIFAPKLSSAKVNSHHHAIFLNEYDVPIFKNPLTDTSKKQRQELDEKKKIKEIAKAPRHSKPEKIDENDVPEANKTKPKRQRRPEGLERPPEIPRRNGN